MWERKITSMKNDVPVKHILYYLLSGSFCSWTITLLINFLQERVQIIQKEINGKNTEKMMPLYTASQELNKKMSFKIQTLPSTCTYSSAYTYACLFRFICPLEYGPLPHRFSLWDDPSRSLVPEIRGQDDKKLTYFELVCQICLSIYPGTHPLC